MLAIPGFLDLHSACKVMEGGLLAKSEGAGQNVKDLFYLALSLYVFSSAQRNHSFNL